MSMNLYLTSGPEAELMKMARDPNALTAMSMSHVMGRMKAFGASGPSFDNVQLDEKAFEKQLKDMGRAAWRQGVLAGLTVMMLKGTMRRNFRKAQGAIDVSKQATVSDAPPPDILDLHKSWHMLHYAFTGTAWEGEAPANTLLLGGKEVGEDLGYGPVRVVDAAAVEAFARFLNAQSPRSVKSRIDMKRMAELEIYCAEDDDEMSKSELYDDVDHYLPMLKDYVGTAATKRSGLAIWMS